MSIQDRMASYVRLYKDELLAARAHQKKTVKSLQEAEETLEAVEEAQGILQGIISGIQEHVHNQIAGVVSLCLESVFDEPYVFRLAFEQKRGKTEARLAFERDGMEVDPLTASGGGVVDVAAFALRLSCLMLNKPALRRVLILDEPFKFVSADYRPGVRTMMEELSRRFEIQFIMVTHMEALKFGKVVEL